jgi:hypothetical protein
VDKTVPSIKSKGGERWNNYQSSWRTLWRSCETTDIIWSDGVVFVINVEVNKSHGYNWPGGGGDNFCTKL